MPTGLHSEIPNYEKTKGMNLMPVEKKSSIHYQNVLDKQTISPLKGLGHHYKPWPGRKLSKLDEVFKPILTIPDSVDKGEKAEDKISNFAVPDWGRLEKLTYIKKQVANRKVGDSNVKGEYASVSDMKEPHSSVSSTSMVDLNSKSFPAILLPDDKKFANQSSQVSCSRPFDPHCIKEDKSKMLYDNMKGKQANVKVRSSSPLRRDLSPHRLIRAGINRMRSTNSRESSSVSFDSSKMPSTPCSDYSCDDSTSSTRRARRTPSPKRILNAGLNMLRNSSAKEASLERSTKESICSDSSFEDDATSSTRGRRSPLRRLFDPLKPKSQVHVSGPISSLPSHRVIEASKKDKLPIRDELSLVHKPINNSSRQALLKLNLKNGIPLFVFSSCDSNILAATVRKLPIKSECEFIYTMFAALEVKKKVGAWTNHVNKNKKHDMASNVVAHMRVASSMSTKEFVLCDGKQNSTVKNELGAVVVNDQNGATVIIPKGIHGIASAGEPSPLVERWKSGGKCDCGGWDEGCMLTILTNSRPEKTSCSASDQIEFFTQGRKIDIKYAFSMTAFREGIYTVDFGVNISYLQAFAMCISALHSKFNHSVEEQNSSEQMNMDSTCIDAVSYVPEHPPLSPMKRA